MHRGRANQHLVLGMGVEVTLQQIKLHFIPETMCSFWSLFCGHSYQQSKLLADCCLLVGPATLLHIQLVQHDACRM